MHTKFNASVRFVAVMCLLLLDIGLISSEDCDTKKQLFVNTSDTVVFSVDFNEIRIIIDKLFPFPTTYFEFYFALKPDREMILHMSKSGYIEFIDRRYSNRTRVKSAKGIVEIAIKDVTRSDGGNYTLDIPKMRTSICFTVYVLGTPTKPKLVPSSHTVEEGSQITLNCTSSSTTYPLHHNRSLSYTWEIDGEPLLANRRNTRFTCNVKSNILEIVRTNRNDSKRPITCKVQEKNGLSSATFLSLSVTWGPKLILDMEPASTVYILHTSEKVPIVTCKAYCYPACNLTWRKVGVNITSLYSRENVLDLGTFDNKKAGEYICIARRPWTRRVGFRSVTFKINGETDALQQEVTTDTSHVIVVGRVLGALFFLSVVAMVCLVIKLLRLGTPTKPKLVPSSQTVEEGTQITLNCTSSSTAYPSDQNKTMIYTWEIDGESLFKNRGYARFRVKSNILEIVKTSRNDSKRPITCKVQEKNGLSGATSLSLNVTWGPKLILDLESASTVYNLHTSEKVPIVTCKADCYPACNITWSKVGVNITSLYNALKRANTSDTSQVIVVGSVLGVLLLLSMVAIVCLVNIKVLRLDALKHANTTDTSQVVVVGSVLGGLLLLSMVAIVCLVIKVLSLERLNRTQDKRTMGIEANGTILTNTNDNYPAYEELDANTRNQHTYEGIQKGPGKHIYDVPSQSMIYENQNKMVT